VGITVFKSGRQEVFIGVRYLNIDRKSGLQKRIAPTISVSIKRIGKWIHVLIIGAVNASADRQTELVFVHCIQFVRQIKRRKKLAVCACERRIFHHAIAPITTSLVWFFVFPVMEPKPCAVAFEAIENKTIRAMSLSLT
jgi:hypothetical protein